MAADGGGGVGQKVTAKPAAPSSIVAQHIIPVGGNTQVNLDYSAALQPNTAAAPLTVRLPAGAKVYTFNGSTVVVYEPMPGLKISYDATLAATQGRLDYGGATPQPVDATMWGGELSTGVVQAGQADELATYPANYQEFWDSTIMTVLGPNNPAAKDADVMKVMAGYAGRPDMSPDELQNQLQGTSWYQNHTQAELRWNDLGDAEKQVQRDEMSGKMAQIYLQYFGVAVPTGDPRITNYLEQVVSGKMGIGAFTETVKLSAATDGESPWSRQLRSEQDERGKYGTDTENRAQQVKDIYHQWGVPISAESAMDMATKLMGNKMSDADILTQVQSQAQVMYPWKDPMLDTTTAAAPWMETFRRTMEKPVDIYNSTIQAALTAGQPVFEFEKQLKKTDEWMGTKNGKDTMQSTISQLGRKMGFQ